MNTMNSKLRAFERESGLEIYGLGARRKPWEHAMEQFAHLIILECADFLKDKLDDHFAAEQLVEHFGVDNEQ